MKTYEKVNLKQSFPELEENILKFWKENKIFEESVEFRPKDKPYRFYDGPPFITGTPHYGSLLSSICKDIVPRYWTMKGFRVERTWGWDCHGIPIEDKVQKKLGLGSNKEIEKVGIKKFIEECYKYTNETSQEWEWYIDHIGRWVDFKNSYKTMDKNYMESVIQVFKKLYDKGLIYKGDRISLYSWKLGTPISNFEIAMDDSYEEVSDPAITVEFPIESNKKQFGNCSLLAWTTTPWTIPAHMAIAVNKDLAYSQVKSEGKYYILATARVETVFKGKEYEIIEDFMGDKLVGLKYEAPFDYYQGKVNNEKNFVVYHADFVTDNSGVGIAHEAPEFGDVDFELAKEKGMYITNAVDNEGKYTSEISDLEGTHFKDSNDIVCEKLKEMGKLFKKESITHRVAMCPRTNTPLIYKVQNSWFINIQSIKEKLIQENEGINWSPEHLKHGQFLKSMESAPDWCISRTRYWGTPMPIWMGYDNDGNEKDMKVLGSIEEIEKLSGMKVTDLHRPYIDDITWEENGLTYKRISEVLDCWVESGSMPYAWDHYPFENKEKMEASFPADFIVEYIGQVRAWFYVMHVIGVALFDTRAFTNVITTGIVYGNDGRKMSKSYGNYPNPKETIQKYGADAIRFYMTNSTLLSGGNTSFSEDKIVEVIKKVILPLWNTYSFFTTYANIDNFESKGLPKKLDNNLDIWLISELNILTRNITNSFDEYKLNEATKDILRFMDNLTNWYVRRSRKRFWKTENDGDKLEAYETLYYTLVILTKIIAPFMPFISEHIYKELTGNKSVHLTDFPTFDSKSINEKLNNDTDKIQKIITLGLAWRANNKIRVRQPLRSITITDNLEEYYINIIKEELNIKEVLVVDGNSLAKEICKPNGRVIGPKFGKDVKFIMTEAKSGNFEKLDDGKIKVSDFILEELDYELVFETGDSDYKIETGFGMVIAMDDNITKELELEGYYRDIVRHIQEARKEAGFNVDDRIKISVVGISGIINNFKKEIGKETLSSIESNLENYDLEKNIEVGGMDVVLKLKK